MLIISLLSLITIGIGSIHPANAYPVFAQSGGNSIGNDMCSFCPDGLEGPAYKIEYFGEAESNMNNLVSAYDADTCQRASNFPNTLIFTNPS